MLDIGFKQKKSKFVVLDDSDISDMLSQFDPSLPFELNTTPSVLERCKSFFSSPCKALLVLLVLACALLACLLVPLVLSLVATRPVTLRNDSFILATFHGVLGVVAIPLSNLSSSSNRPFYSSLVQVGDEPRGLLLLPDGSLLFAQSRTTNSRVWRLKNACSGFDLSVFSSEAAALSHPYGLAYSPRARTVFVSNQNGNSIVALNMTGGLKNELFASLGSPRGIAVSPSSGSVFAASNAENLLVEFSDKGQRLRTLFVTQPIGVLLSVHLRATETLFVGENGEGATNSSIVMIDAASFSVLDHFRHPQLQHPSGMCEHNHLLLVFSQVTAQILAFNVSSKEGFVFSERILDRPEAMVSVTC